MIRGRDRQAQLDWLRRAIVSDRTGLIAHALRRIDGAGQRAYGDTWRDRHVGALIAEMREEAADIPGWGSFAALLLAEHPDIDTAAKVDALLAQACEYAAAADVALAAAEELAHQLHPPRPG